MKELLPINIAPSPLLPGKMLIAGPCSAESEADLTSVAKELEHCAGALRAGVWKPRTRPGSFEGYGELALDWLSAVARHTEMPAATEVAAAEHVKQAAHAGIEILWIGARTSGNPFIVQEIADAIMQFCPEATLLVKNPMNPDLDLWIGALQRFYNTGVRRLGAIHRGFSVYGEKKYRNAPIWQIPLDMHRLYPNLPIIHDPSHTGGKRELIKPLSQTALDLGFDGLMIEVHQDPRKALSDGGQQITPAEFKHLIKQLKVRNGSTADDELNNLRLQIDDIDAELINLLARRMNLTDQIGTIKRTANMTVFQPERYSRLLSALLSRSEEAGIDSDFMRMLFEAIHEESVRRQLSIINTP